MQFSHCDNSYLHIRHCCFILNKDLHQAINKVEVYILIWKSNEIIGHDISHSGRPSRILGSSNEKWPQGKWYFLDVFISSHLKWLIDSASVLDIYSRVTKWDSIIKIFPLCLCRHQNHWWKSEEEKELTKVWTNLKQFCSTLFAKT